jgi:hypothetical protein
MFKNLIYVVVLAFVLVAGIDAGGSKRRCKKLYKAFASADRKVFYQNKRD